jgi:DNA (cytosine-5)-methyltransferase 1
MVLSSERMYVLAGLSSSCIGRSNGAAIVVRTMVNRELLGSYQQVGNRIKVIDFFCGAGGLTRGLLDAGLNVLAGIDFDMRLQKTYERNNAPSRFLCKDIKDIEIHELRSALGIGPSDVVLYAACTPCQPFSTLNQMKGKDDRKHLLIEFARLVRQAPPDFILVENVPSTAYGREIYEQFSAVLRESGFAHSDARLLDAADFGVPQVRKRFILMASRGAKIELPDPSVTAHATVREFLEKYPALEDGDASEAIPNHSARRLMPQHRKILEAVPRNGGSRQDIEDTSILLPCHQKKPKVHKDVFGRMSWDRPAPTLTCRCTDVYCGRFAHPEQNRGLSLREAAALQTFPDDYEFFGTFFHIAAQIGNAVPVKLACQLGQVIAQVAQEAGND